MSKPVNAAGDLHVFLPSFRPQVVTKISSCLTRLSVLASIGVVALGYAACRTYGFKATLSAPLALLAGLSSYRLYHLFMNIVSGGPTLRGAVFTSSEQLSKSYVRGGMPTITLGPMIEALKSCTSQKALELAEALESVYQYQNSLSLIFGSTASLDDQYLDYLSTIQEGKTYVFALSTMVAPAPCLRSYYAGSHIMAGTLERVGDSFTVRIYNAGDGQHYHPKRSYRVYQTCIEAKQISWDKFCRFFKTVSKYHAMSPCNETRFIYEAFFEMKGTLSGLLDDERLNLSAQKGASCSGYSFRCLIQGQLSPSEFLEFEKNLLKQSLKKLFRDYTEGAFYRSTDEHLIAYCSLAKRYQALEPSFEPATLSIQNSWLRKMASKSQGVFWELFCPKEQIYRFDDGLDEGSLSSALLSYAPKSLLVTQFESTLVYFTRPKVLANQYNDFNISDLKAKATSLLKVIEDTSSEPFSVHSTLPEMKIHLQTLIHLIENPERPSEAFSNCLKALGECEFDLLREDLMYLEPKGPLFSDLMTVFDLIRKSKTKQARRLLISIYERKAEVSFCDFAKIWNQVSHLKTTNDLETLDVYTGLLKLSQSFSMIDGLYFRFYTPLLRHASLVSEELALDLMFRSPWYDNNQLTEAVRIS